MTRKNTLGKHVGTTCNAIAMASLQHGEEDAAIELLRRALQMSQVLHTSSQASAVRNLLYIYIPRHEIGGMRGCKCMYMLYL